MGSKSQKMEKCSICNRFIVLLGRDGDLKEGVYAFRELEYVTCDLY